ncbi:MAG: hypothetical protein IJM90_01910 [Firmicutes bacterium]|nr:hypothetical protein [Bacillota bacterium]
MRTFLIDLENVKNQGLSGVEFLQPEDRVFIFYSESANTLSIPTIQAMNRSRAVIDYVHLQHSGRNAMDFQIVALLGFLIGSERSGQFCIVSQDNGYLSPVEFFMDHAADQLDVHVLVAGSIMKAVNKWNALARQNAAVPRVAAAEPVMEYAPAEITEPEPEPEPVYVEEPEPEEEPEQPAVEEPVPEPEPVAPAPEPVPAEPVREVPEAHKEEKKNNRKSGNRRRTKKAAEHEDAVPAKAAEEPRPAEPAPTAEEKEPEAKPEPKPEEKPETKPETKSEPKRKSGSKSGRSTKKAAAKEPEKEAPKPEEEQPAEAPKAEVPKAEAPKKRKPIVVSQDLLGRIHEVLKDTLPEDAQSRNERVVGEALLATETKNEFYQYFRRTMGVQEGGNLYKAVRGEYDRLQKALAETL